MTRGSEAALAGAEERIQKHRTSPARLRFVDGAGQPMARARLRVRLVRHRFRLGCNAFRLGNLADPALQRAYEERFAALFNYATLPFYWGHYEPQPGQTSESRLERMAAWCADHGIAAKGHPLAWHEVYPPWANALADDEIVERQERRIREIVAHFRGRIDLWDVVNEATISHRFDHALGRWIEREGAARCVAQALRWARQANPGATLLYNDFNVSPDLEALLAELLRVGAPLDAIGIQSHMHKFTWPLERAWQTCETYARFGLPLHFTETTVISYDVEARTEEAWRQMKASWQTTAVGEERQAAYGAQFYTLLFSHPAVEAITWWDLSDNGAWMGAPAGLLRADMTPKPLYEWLVEAFHRRWTTDVEVITDAAGEAALRGFHGDYEAHGRAAFGAELHGAFALAGPAEAAIQVTLR